MSSLTCTYGASNGLHDKAYRTEHILTQHQLDTWPAPQGWLHKHASLSVEHAIQWYLQRCKLEKGLDHPTERSIASLRMDTCTVTLQQ